MVIDTATETLTILDFGNVGLFPLAERRFYLTLYLASIGNESSEMVKAVRGFYPGESIPNAEERAIEKIAHEIWADPLQRVNRLELFLARAVNEVGLPVPKSVSSLLRGMSFLRIETLELNSLLAASDPRKKIPRLDFDKTVENAMKKGFKREFSKTLFGTPTDAFLSRPLLRRTVEAFLSSRFVQPCMNLLRLKKSVG